MNFRTLKVGSVLGMALLPVLGLLLALSPATALAQTRYASAVLYEIQEDVDCHPDCDITTAGFGTRIADATIVGGVPPFPGGALGGVAGEFTGSVTLEASSVLSQVDWTGPISGKFTLQNILGNTVTGALSGQLDLSQAIFSGIPLGPVSGHWRGTKGTLSAGGTFSGVFLIPFPCPSPLSGACYLELDPSTGQPTMGVTQLEPNEYVIIGFTPVPLVKFVVVLFVK